MSQQDEEEKVGFAIENTKRQLARKFNAKLAPQKVEWDKLVLNFREAMIAEMRRGDVRPTVVFQFEPWMIQLLPCPQDSMKRLVKESLDSDDYKEFLVKTVGNHHMVVQVDLFKLLPIMEHYQEGLRKKRRTVVDLESQMTVDDQESMGKEKEDVETMMKGLMEDFVQDTCEIEQGSELLLEDFTVYYCWCTWCCERINTKEFGEQVVRLFKDKRRPGRQKFMELFLKHTGLETTVVKKRTMVKGLRIRATPKTPWLPF